MEAPSRVSEASTQVSEASTQSSGTLQPNNRKPPVFNPDSTRLLARPMRSSVVSNQSPLASNQYLRVWIKGFQLESPALAGRPVHKLDFKTLPYFKRQSSWASNKITRTSPPSGPLPCLHQEFTKKVIEIRITGQGNR